MSDHPEEACVNCHFFSGADGGPDEPVSEKLRDEAREGNFNWGTVEENLRCSKGVWDEREVEYDNDDRFREYVKRDRSDECFFWPYTEGMLREAAEELQEREQERKRFWERNKWVRRGAVAAIVAVIVNAIFQALNFLLH